MRMRTFVRCSASIAAFALAATPLWAQDAPAADAADQESVAQPTPGEASEGEEIVVTGLRQSLQSARNIRRDSDQIVDVIVAEDIGKLPDRTVSEALTRVPGVTVERAQAEAGDVFVRGLRDPATTYNGRDIFTAEARNVAPQDFPAGTVAVLEVYKSQTAELIEGNLAGLINVRSRNPFDFDGFELAGSLNGTYADLSEDPAWNGNLLVSNRWAVGDGEIGALLNISYTELEYQDSIRFVSGDFFGINPDPAVPGTYRDNFGNNIPGTTVRVPAGVGLFQNAGQRWRPSANATIEWRPSSDLRFYVDGLYQGFRRRVSDRQLFVPLFGAGAYTNVEIGQSGEFDYPSSLLADSPVRGEGFQAATREQTDTYQFAVGGVYDTDRIRVSADLAHTQSKFDLSVYSVDYALTSQPDVDVIFDTSEGSGGTQFTMGGLDLTNLSNYRYRGFFDRQLIAEGDDIQGRLDFTIKNPLSFITAFDFGIRYGDRDAGFSNGQRYSPQEGLGLPYGDLPLDFAQVPWNFRDDVLGINQLVLPTYDSIRGAVGQLRDLAGFPGGLPAVDPLTTYSANEKSYTGYVQLRYAFGDDVDGVIGVRAIKTEFSLDGNILVNTGAGSELQPLSVDNDYEDYLPNVSIRWRPAPGFQLRAAYTQTRRRADFGQLNPGLTIDPPGGGPRTGRGGNPNLLPILSDNYDLSLEYYFSRTGFASLSVFRREVSNFIVDLQAEQIVPGLGPVLISGPVNAGDGRLQGIEAQVRTFFDFGGMPEFLRNFGVELNATYIDNQLSPPPSAGPNASDIQFPEVSEWTYNLVGFYERGPLTARVAYNFRDDYSQFFTTQTSGFFSGEFVGGVSRLDASISYALSDRLTIAADVSNILGDPFRNFRQIESGVVTPRDVRFEERVYSAGIRFRF